MLGAIALAERIGTVLLAKYLRDVSGNNVDYRLQARFVKTVVVGPGRHGVRVDQAIIADLCLVTFKIVLHLICVSSHCFPLLGK